MSFESKVGGKDCLFEIFSISSHYSKTALIIVMMNHMYEVLKYLLKIWKIVLEMLLILFIV